MEMKSRLLSPKPEHDEAQILPDASLHEDPRRELVQQLLAYQRFRTAAETLDSLRDEFSKRWTASGAAGEVATLDGEPTTVEQVQDLDIGDVHLLDLLESRLMTRRLVCIKTILSIDWVARQSAACDLTPSSRGAIAWIELVCSWRCLNWRASNAFAFVKRRHPNRSSWNWWTSATRQLQRPSKLHQPPPSDSRTFGETTAPTGASVSRYCAVAFTTLSCNCLALVTPPASNPLQITLKVA